MNVVEYYDAECTVCGWKHRLTYTIGQGRAWGHALAIAKHAAATHGTCSAKSDEIREQAPQEQS